ncbi:MAG TPA: PEP-CTERM sorting domain-containing protein [Bryobacteraceae bacterium]|nr:PEP-CTERM sorting domain-containing protein [Bryobacteraceae bacterium]
MRSFSKVVVGGLLWLAFSALAFGDTLYISAQTENVSGGGQFSATLASNPAQDLLIYCVDFQNYTYFAPYPVNISTPDVTNPASVANTRYGTTPDADFTYDPNSLPAVQRYVMAAWLVTQYDFSSGVSNNDLEIQNSIWTLLNTSGSTSGFPNGDSAGTGTYVTQAISWLNGQSQIALQQFGAGVQIFDSTDVAGTDIPARWTTGFQEMITVTTTPEPGTLTLLGAGLLGLGLIRRRFRN